MAPELPDPLVGSMLGKDYRVLAPIGMGGMAVVYLVEHQTLLKQFAAKVLSSALASSLEARARFAQEAHAASQLDHENIVTISDFGVTVDHRPFFVMELLRGQTLDQRLAEGAMTIEEVVAVSVPVARALSHAHAEGIVHLDIKPENIFLVQRSQGRWGVKVVDFGIAKTPDTGTTPLGETSGSPMFMAPETCRGDAQIDQRADVYSFGILLYLMMCGRLPFVDDSLQRVLQMQLVQLPAPPRELNADLTPEVAAIVERALAKRPEDRYPTMAALMRDLEAALPPGSDRLLIEAASGARMGGTPFAGALAGLQRPSQPHAVVATPAAPSRRRIPVVAITALAVTILGAVLWRQLTVSAAPGRDRVAQARPTPPLRAEAAPPTRVELEVAPVAAAKPETAETASDATPATARPAEPTSEPGEPGLDPATQPATQAVIQAAIQPSGAASALAVAAAVSGARDPVLGHRIATRAVPRRDAVAAPTIGASPALPARPAPAAPAAPAGAPESPPAVAPSTPAVAPSRPAVAIEAAPAPPPELAPPAVLPSPATPVAVKPPPVARGSLDAIPALVSLEVKGSLSPSIVRRSMERTLGSLRACYRTAARASNTTPAVELRLTFEVDENSLATHVATTGAGFGSLASCVASVAGQIRTQEAPDVGTAQVIVVIGFRPS